MADYNVTMTANERTYHYKAYRENEDGTYDVKEYDFLDVVDMYPSEVKNANDAYNALFDHIGELFA